MAKGSRGVGKAKGLLSAGPSGRAKPKHTKMGGIQDKATSPRHPGTVVASRAVSHGAAAGGTSSAASRGVINAVAGGERMKKKKKKGDMGW